MIPISSTNHTLGPDHTPDPIAHDHRGEERLHTHPAAFLRVRLMLVLGLLPAAKAEVPAPAPLMIMAARPL